jgi:hypothetical protein
LSSTDAQNHAVLRCQSSSATAEFHFGDARTKENLSFIPIQEAGGKSTEFGLVRESGGWRIISLGLLLFDIPQLSKQWAQQDLEAREAAVVKTILALADAIGTYQRAFGKLPESLAQMGPAPREGASPDAANLINENLAAGNSAGYRYRYRIAPAADGAESQFELAASPADYGKTGKRSFFRDTHGKIHAADHQGAVASEADPAIAPEAQP